MVIHKKFIRNYHNNIKAQLDFITNTKNMSNGFLNCAAYNSIDFIGSDHWNVLTNIWISPIANKTNWKNCPKYDCSLLKIQPEKKPRSLTKVYAALKSLNDENDGDSS